MQLNPLDTELRHLTHRNGDGGIFILADDLTGACDSGAAFLASGRTVRVVIDIASVDMSSSQHWRRDAVLAFTTETRNLTPEQAAVRVADTMGLLRNVSSDHILFKKVDSAARGHQGAETMAALDASRAALALVAPAFPHAGRTVHAGILSIRDAAEQNTTVKLRDLFPSVDAAHIRILPAGAADALDQEITRALAGGVRVLLCDSEDQADLERLATAAYRLQQPILWTGSAGLANAMATVLPAPPQVEPVRPTHRNGRTLLFVGSDHPVTALQVSHLEENSAAPDHAIHHVDWDSPSHQTIRAAFAAAPVAALVLTGGDTAAFVLQALDASSILLAGEVAPGIPWGIVEGGDADGCIVVTKSGGFGPRNALVQTIEFCNWRVCEPA